MRKTGHFQWSDVLAIRGYTITKHINIATPYKITKVRIKLSGEDISFDSSNYPSKEFRRKIRIQMLLNLFETYYELARLVKISVQNKKNSEKSDWKKKIV